MRRFTYLLTLLLLCVAGGVRADVITTKPLPGVEYKIKCIATDHSGYLGDDGTTLQGRHATGTIFVLEATSTANQYYLKSKETGKYINAAGNTSGSAISFDATATTYWTLDQTNANTGKYSWAIRPNGTAGVSLNNNGVAGNACPYMKVNVHNSNTQGCDLWTFDDVMDQQSPMLPDGKFIQISDTKADFLTVATGADDNEHWYVMTQTRGGETPMYDNGMNTIKRAATSTVINGQTLAGNEKYLVRFFSTDTDGQYYVQFATGRYVASDLTVNSRAGAQAFMIYNINSEATHIGWNIVKTDGTCGKHVNNNGAGSTIVLYGSEQVLTSTGSNGDWSIYPVSFIDAVPISFTLTAPETGQTFSGSYASGWVGENTLLPVLNGAGAYTLSNASFTQDGEAYSMTADIAFPFPVSTTEKKTPTGIRSDLGPATWRAKANDSGVYQAYSTNNAANITVDNADEFQWYIYPSYSDGFFSFKIQNKVSGKYFPSFSATQSANTVNALVDETSAGSFYLLPCNSGYYGFSINSAGQIFLTINSGTTDNQSIWTWSKNSSHRGSNLTFPTIAKSEEAIRPAFAALKAATPFDILEGSIVQGPSEFANPTDINTAIAEAQTIDENSLQAMYDFNTGTNGQMIQNYLNQVATYGALFNHQFTVTHQYGTIILPCPSTKPDGITFYSCSATEEDGTTLTLTDGGNMEANKPYIYESTVGNKYTIIGWDKGNRANHANGWLTGSLAEAGANVPDGSYVLAANKTTGKQGFYVTNGSVTCPQFKCYMTVPAEAAAPKVLFFPGGEGEQTGIENVFGADENGTVTIYNLAGQRLNKLEKGINIVNGRKVLVK